MNKEKVIYMEPKVLFAKQWKEKRHRTNRRRNFPWHTIAIVLGIVCFFLLLTTTVLGYIYFQSRGKNMECTKERNTSGTEPSVLQPFIGRSAPFSCSLFVLEKSRFLNLNNGFGSVRDSLLPTELGRRAIPNIGLLGCREIIHSLCIQSEVSKEVCKKHKSLNGLELVDDGGFCFQDKDYGTCQGKWFCCGKDCYYFSKEEKSWDESEKLCRVLGSSLIKIDDQKEQIFIQSKINYNHWVGLHRKGANHPWKWQDGSSLSKNLNFQESTSDAKCGSLKSPNITPDICTREFRYICEKVFTCLNN